MDTGKIKEIISIFEQSTLSTMELEGDDLKIKLSKDGAGSPLSVERVEQPQPKPVEHAAEIAEGDAVRSPLVGTFYAAASENAKPFVEIARKKSCKHYQPNS